MRSCQLTALEISNAVKDAIDRLDKSIRQICQDFNNDDGFLGKYCPRPKPLDKDFIQRIKSNRFEVISDRVLILCDYLNIDTHISSDKYKSLQEEFSMLERLARSNPQIENKLKSLLSNFADLLNTKGVVIE